MPKDSPAPIPDGPPVVVLNPRYAGATPEMVALALLRSPPCDAAADDEDPTNPRPGPR